MMERLTNMLGEVQTLLFYYTMRRNYYSTTYMLLYPHLMAKLAWMLAENQDFLTRNPPTCGCKSMMEGLTIMLGVLLTLLYT